MIKLWNRLIHIGVYNDTPPDLIREIRLLNQFSLILIIVNVLSFLIPNQVLWSPYTLLILGLTCLLPLTIIFMQKSRLYMEAKWLLFIGMMSITLGWYLVIGPESGTNFSFVCYPFLAGIFFKNKLSRIIIVLVSILFFSISFFLSDLIEPLVVVKSMYQIKFMSFVIIGVLLYYLSVFFLNENEKYDRQQKQMMEQINEKNEELRQFAAMTSHDLAEPLKTMKAYSGLLKKEYGIALGEDGLEMLNTMEKISNNTDQLLKDLLKYTVSEIETIEQTSVDLNEVINRAEEQLDVTIQKSKAIIIKDRLPVVSGNFNKLVQVFQNIISNAIKYQPLKEKSGSYPEIKISSEFVNNEYLISISDNGIGIDQEHIEMIFMPFKRLHNKNEYEGTGLGLATCKKIIERLGGKISVHSVVGKGTTFNIVLPV